MSQTPLLLFKRRSGFSPLSFGSDLALWLDPSYGVYTDRSTQLTAASSQYWSVASNASLQTGDVDCWFGCWVYFNANGVTYDFADKYGAAGNREWILERFGGDNKVYLSVSADGTASVDVVTTAAVLASSWHFVFWCHDSVSNTLSLSVDGGTFVDVSHSTGLFAGTAAFQLGANITPTNFLNGQLDSVMFGKSPVGGIAALATTIRDYLFNSGAGRVYADISAAQATAWGLVSAWDFDGDGLDAHGSNDLTAVNSPAYTSGIASGVAGDGDVVSLIVPRAGSNLTPPSYAKRATWNAGGGRPYFQSAASWGYNLASTIAQNATAWQCFAVYERHATTDASYRWILQRTTPIGSEPACMLEDGKVQLYVGSSRPTTADTLSAESKSVLMWCQDAAKVYSRLGAGTLREESIVSARSVWNSVGEHAAGFEAHGKFYDLLLFDDRILSTAEETQLRNWLAAKNGVTL